jgi:hypothetical protein
MVIMLEGYTTEELRSAVHYFFVDKSTQCKRFYKETFPVYGGKCLSRKAVYNWKANV